MTTYEITSGWLPSMSRGGLTSSGMSRSFGF
jgi:hypothetical protein